MPIHIVTIGGSPTHPSRTAALLDYSADALTTRGHTVHRVVIRDLDSTALVQAQADSPTIRTALDQIAQSNALIIASPVYKATYSGVLKCLLDLIPQDGLANKAVLPILCGAAPNHALALDHSFKPVFAALTAGVVLPGLYILDKQVEYKPILNFADPAAKNALDSALDMLIRVTAVE